MTDALEVTGLTVRYGGVTAVSNVNLSVANGELVGLIGPNGAGKTTFIDAVTGFTKSEGKVRLAGSRIGGLAPHQRAKRGMARTWQLGELFDDLTVAENLSVAAADNTTWQTIRDVLRGRSERRPTVDAILERLGISDLANRSAAELTEGQRKLVGVGRAIAADPVFLLLDEPAAGLDSNESAKLGDTLRSIVADGVGMLLVDHDMGLVMSVCDRIVVLNFGEVIAEGTPEQVRNNPAVIRAYLGSSGETANITVVTPEGIDS